MRILIMKTLILLMGLGCVIYQFYCAQQPLPTDFEKLFAVWGVIPVGILFVIQLFIRPKGD